jgi:hypothetical protein
MILKGKVGSHDEFLGSHDEFYEQWYVKTKDFYKVKKQKELMSCVG